MKYNKFTLFSITIMALVSCGNNSSQQIDYKEVSSANGIYSVEIPSNLTVRKTGDMISIENDKPQIMGLIKETSEKKFFEESYKPSEDKGFSCSKIESSDSTVFYRVSKGMFSAYEMFLLKKTNDNNLYLIHVSSTDLSKDELRRILTHMSTSFKKIVGEPTVANKTLSTTAVQKVNGKTYSRPTYSIQYPSDWTVLENLNEMTDAYIGDEAEGFGFTIVRFPTDESLLAIANEGNEELKNAGAKILRSQMTNLNGRKCHYTEIQLTVSGITATHISYTFKEKGMLYNIKFGSITSASQRSSCKNIIKSLG